jgi:AraC family transcriptional regulator of adaptative response / DNA-3-methyladenine glycosylase II
MDDDALYQLFLRRDPANNGRFLTGVLSTGIYCLPSCPARRPLRQNVRFFKTPEEAVSTGLRPCLRCHPDAFYRGEEWHENLFEQTAARARNNPASFRDIADLARVSGLSRTALNQLFRNHAQESPAAFLRRTRVDFAARLLASGSRPLDAAAAAGFGSSSTFHQQFAAWTAMTPAAFAELRTAKTFTLQLPTDYAIAPVLSFHGRDPNAISERVTSDSITKCMGSGILEIRFVGTSAICRADGLDTIDAHRIAIRMLGLGQDAAGFARQFATDPLLGPLILQRPGLRIPQTSTPWEGLAWAIIGQQIGLNFAISMRSRLIALAGTRHPSGLISHPDPAAVARLEPADLRALQFSKSKADYLLEAARRIAAGEIDLNNLRNLSAKHAARLLGTLRGVGPWTIDYVFLRGLGFPDSFPSGDAGIAQAIQRLTGTRPPDKEIRALAERFAPYRSLAAAHLWASLQDIPKEKLA